MWRRCVSYHCLAADSNAYRRHFHCISRFYYFLFLTSLSISLLRIYTRFLFGFFVIWFSNIIFFFRIFSLFLFRFVFLYLYCILCTFIYKNVTELNRNKSNNGKLLSKIRSRHLLFACSDDNNNRRLTVNYLDCQLTFSLSPIDLAESWWMTGLSFPIWLEYFYDRHAKWTLRTSHLNLANIWTKSEIYLGWVGLMIGFRAMKMLANPRTIDKWSAGMDFCKPVKETYTEKSGANVHSKQMNTQKR